MALPPNSSEFNGLVHSPVVVTGASPMMLEPAIAREQGKHGCIRYVIQLVCNWVFVASGDDRELRWSGRRAACVRRSCPWPRFARRESSLLT
ncbi:MAG: hypothetical protein IBJ17_11580 [Reyranella sp.]|jgi:hypothetical protein|nr:hypothetical protein [Reyranella sp.]